MVKARALVALAAVSLGVSSGCSSGAPAGRTLECPSAPFHARVTSGDLETDPLRGPAPGDVSRGVFVHRLSLDNGAFTALPPRSHDRAGYPGGDALCEVMASTTVNGFGVGRQSPDTIAAGLARVTVNPSTPSFLAQMYGDRPKPPKAARYADRLAWVFVIAPPIRSNGPAPTCPRPTEQERATHHNYAVFVVDAQTGGDALLYTEGDYGAICAGAHETPHVDVPVTYVSLPWRLVSEKPDRSGARIAIDVTSCDGYEREVRTDPSSKSEVIRVVVSRPFGPPCGPAKSVVVNARPAALGNIFTTALVHAPVGPYVDLP